MQGIAIPAHCSPGGDRTRDLNISSVFPRHHLFRGINLWTSSGKMRMSKHCIRHEGQRVSLHTFLLFLSHRAGKAQAGGVISSVRNIMSTIKEQVIAANAAYAAEFGDKGNLPMPPGRGFAILTCMDARLDPAKYAGLAEGDAHIIRNAGGRASDDAIRSLVISYKLLGTREWFVIHHTDCGMETFNNEIMGNLLESSLKTSRADKTGWHDSGEGSGTTEGRYINWLTIRDQEQSVVEDVVRIRNSSMVPPEIPIYGYLYDCRTGRLIEVSAATQAGAVG